MYINSHNEKHITEGPIKVFKRGDYYEINVKYGIRNFIDKYFYEYCLENSEIDDVSIFHFKMLCTKNNIKNSNLLIINQYMTFFGYLSYKLEFVDKKHFINHVKKLLYFLADTSIFPDFTIDYTLPGYGNSSLMWSIANGNVCSARMLIEEFSANPFVLDNDRKTTLHLLVAKGHERQSQVFDIVISHSEVKKHINHKMRYGFTALHFACARRDLKYIEKLLTVGGDLSIKDDNNRTPLNILELSEFDRLKILSYALGNSDDLKLDCESLKKSMRGVATINDNIFNSDTKIIRERIRRLDIIITEVKNFVTTAERGL